MEKFSLPFHVNVTVSKLDYDRVGEALRSAEGLGVESVSVIPSMAFGRALETSFIGRAEFMKGLAQAEEVAEELGVEVSVWCAPFLGSLRGFRNLRYGNRRRWRELDLSPSGKVLLCDAMGVEAADALEDGIIGSWLKLNTHPLYLRVRLMPDGCCGNVKRSADATLGLMISRGAAGARPLRPRVRFGGTYSDPPLPSCRREI